MSCRFRFFIFFRVSKVPKRTQMTVALHTTKTEGIIHLTSVVQNGDTAFIFVTKFRNGDVVSEFGNYRLVCSSKLSASVSDFLKSLSKTELWGRPGFNDTPKSESRTRLTLLLIHTLFEYFRFLLNCRWVSVWKWHRNQVLRWEVLHSSTSFANG